MPEPDGREAPQQQPPPSGERPGVQQADKVGFNPWNVLGFTTPDKVRAATPDEIKRNYLQIAKENHPDKAGDDPDAAERMKAAGHAYEILSDVKKKEYYELGMEPYIYTSTPADPERGQRMWDLHQAELLRRQGGTGSSTSYSGGESYGSSSSAGSAPPRADQETRQESPTQWWQQFDSPLNNFDFDGKTDQQGRSRTERPRRKPGGESERDAQDRITREARRSRDIAKDHARSAKTYSEIGLSNYSGADKHKKLQRVYDEYNAEVNRIDQAYKRRFFKDARTIGFLGGVTSAHKLETDIIDRLRNDGHNSIDPKIYVMPDGTYLRISSYFTGDRDDPKNREDTTRIEHITGEKDENGFYLSRGIEIVREGKTDDTWLRRIARPYNLHKLDPQSLRMVTYPVIFEPYMSIVTEVDITQRELRDYRAMLQQSTSREQPVGV